MKYCPNRLIDLARFALPVLAVLSCIAIPTGHARAGGEPVLREQITVYGDLVTLGDMFDNAGETSGTAVFRSPELGTTGVVAATRVAAAARQHGIEWRNPGGIDEVVVNRPGRLVPLEKVEEIIGERAGDREDSWTVSFDRGARAFHIDPRVEGPVTVKHLELHPRSGRFRAVISVDNPPYPVQDKVYTGRAYPSVEAIVPAREIERGATIVEEDLEVVQLPRSQVSNSALERVEAAVGMAARRRLPLGRAIRRGDLEYPKLVKRNSLVTLVYRSPGLVLKAKGRALDDGAKGQTVQIVNLQSKRTVEAQVTGAGMASVSALQPALPARPARGVRTVNRNTGGKNSHVVR